jgi:hypothetical protein
MAAWPGTVPTSANIETLTEVDKDALLSFSPDVGPDKRRPRTTLTTQLITYEKVMTQAQWDALLSFYRTTLKQGSSAFTTTHPRTQASIVAMFTEKPGMRALSNAFVNVSISLTVLPINAP